MCDTKLRLLRIRVSQFAQHQPVFYSLEASFSGVRSEVTGAADAGVRSDATGAVCAEDPSVPATDLKAGAKDLQGESRRGAE